MKKSIVFRQYFEVWIETYKKPTVAPSTYAKYENSLAHIEKHFGDVQLHQITPVSYQNAINEYAKTHSKLTVSCFHKQMHACLLDAVDERQIKTDPSRKAIISGRAAEKEKAKYLDYDEWKKLVLATYDTDNIREQIIYLSAVTGLRYAEVLGLTWDNVDFQQGKLTVSKTWDYKYHKGFIATKNTGSIRKIDIDNKTIAMLRRLSLRNKSSDVNRNNLVFHYQEGKQLYSANTNRFLLHLCEKLGIRKISFHSLRHTHASVLLYLGVSLISVSKRLGHSNTATTQNIYLHIIKEMENKERETILGILGDAFASSWSSVRAKAGY